MRAYMYTYGYGDPRLAKELLAGLRIAGDPCGECAECTVGCPRGFDVPVRVGDIVRLTSVPAEFLG
jgi:heterodisulfide reductase subunit C